MANLLTAAEVRAHIHTALTDEALEQLIASADAYIASHAGAHATAVTATLEGGRAIVTLPRPAESVTTASEWYDDPKGAVAVTGHLLVDGGRGLARSPYAASRAVGGYGWGRSWSFGGSRRSWTFGSGSTDSDEWAPWVDVAYTAIDDRPIRINALLQLVRLDLADTGAQFVSDGGYIQSSFGDRQRERQRILEPLIPRYGGASLLA